MTTEELIENYPLLYHMAWEGSWPSIREEGLLTTCQLVDACDPEPEIREAVLARRRPSTITLTHPARGRVMIRDQAPLRPQFLEQSLTDMSVSEWLAVLNNRVFFWLRTDNLTRMLSARLYKKQAHDVLIVDTASLLSTHGDRVMLSAINSGATLYPNAAKRGSKTFVRLQEYALPKGRGRRSLNAITELAVIDGVSDVADHIIRVERRRQNEVLDILFRRQRPIASVDRG